MKTQVVSLFFISNNFNFYLMYVLIYVDIDYGIHKVKLKVTWNEKQKNYLGFTYINTNFEAFL